MENYSSGASKQNCQASVPSPNSVKASSSYCKDIELSNCREFVAFTCHNLLQLVAASGCNYKLHGYRKYEDEQVGAIINSLTVTSKHIKIWTSIWASTPNCKCAPTKKQDIVPVKYAVLLINLPSSNKTKKTHAAPTWVAGVFLNCDARLLISYRVHHLKALMWLFLCNYVS